MDVGEGVGGFAVIVLVAGSGIALEDEPPMEGFWAKGVELSLVIEITDFPSRRYFLTAEIGKLV